MSIPTPSELIAMQDLCESKRVNAKAAWAGYRVVHDQLCALSPYSSMRTPYWVNLPSLPEDAPVAIGKALMPLLDELKRVAMAAGKAYRVAVECEMDAYLRRENALHGDSDSDSDSEDD